MEMEFLEVPVQKTRNVRFVDLDTDFPPQFSFQKPGGSDGNVSEIGSYFSFECDVLCRHMLCH